jgi:putative transposase
LKLHLVFVCKYRKAILNGEIADDIKQFCMDVCKKNYVVVDMMNTDKDRIHLLVDVPPTLPPITLVQYLKQETTWNIWRTHSIELKQHYWKRNVFWSDGYFVCSTGDVSTQTILEYIKSQG